MTLSFSYTICKMSMKRVHWPKNKMKKFLKFSAYVLLTCSFTMVSCSENDDESIPGTTDEPTTETTDEPTTKNVFTAGVPASVGGAVIKTNDKGQVTEIVKGEDVITFEYGDFTPTKATSYTVLMTVDGDGIYMQLNKKGFVEHALRVYQNVEDGTKTWDFEYNSDGQLTEVKKGVGENCFKVAYTNGDILKVDHLYLSDPNYKCEHTIVYENDEHKTPVDNKGCIMEFYSFFGIDMDEMENAYYAGLLGKATKHLPMGKTEKEGSDTYLDVFHWKFNSNNLPIEFWENDDDQYGEVTTFSWK